MAGQNPFRRIRLVYRRSSTAVKCLVLATLVLSTLALMVLRAAIVQTEKELESNRTYAIQLEQENKRLRQSISQLGTVQSITELAEQLLGLVDPDTVIFQPQE